MVHGMQMQQQTKPVISVKRKDGLFSTKEYALVFGQAEAIFVFMDPRALRDETKSAVKAAMDANEGVWGRMAASTGVRARMLRRYAAMQEDELLAVHPKNFAVNHEEVNRVRYQRKSHMPAHEDANEVTYPGKLNLWTKKERYQLVVDEGSSDGAVRSILEQVYGAKFK